jgi:hypothetical protein
MEKWEFYLAHINISLRFSFPSSLFNPFLDLIYFRNFSRYLYHAIYHQGWGDQHSIVGDGFDVLYFNYLSLNT